MLNGGMQKRLEVAIKQRDTDHTIIALKHTSHVESYS